MFYKVTVDELPQLFRESLRSPPAQLRLSQGNLNSLSQNSLHSQNSNSRHSDAGDGGKMRVVVGGSSGRAATSVMSRRQLDRESSRNSSQQSLSMS